jgi:hypothetical protein
VRNLIAAPPTVAERGCATKVTDSDHQWPVPDAAPWSDGNLRTPADLSYLIWRSLKDRASHRFGVVKHPGAY